MADHDVMRRKNEELAAKYHDKNRKFLQIQELYDKVKRQAEKSDIQRAASDAVDASLFSSQFLSSTPQAQDSWHDREANER